MGNPNDICPLCEYADKGGSAFPCNQCARIHDYQDRFSPVDEAAAEAAAKLQATSNRELFLHQLATNGEIAALLTGAFKISCMNCPATVDCIARFPDQPDVGSRNCLSVFRDWLAKGVGE